MFVSSHRILWSPRSLYPELRGVYDHKSSPPAREYFPRRVADFALVKAAAALHAAFISFHDNLLVHADRFQVLHREFRRHRADVTEPRDLAHRFVEKRGDNAAVEKA